MRGAMMETSREGESRREEESDRREGGRGRQRGREGMHLLLDALRQDLDDGLLARPAAGRGTAAVLLRRLLGRRAVLLLLAVA